MSIRGHMVTLSVGITVPFALVGLALLWELWHDRREQGEEERHVEATARG